MLHQTVPLPGDAPVGAPSRHARLFELIRQEALAQACRTRDPGEGDPEAMALQARLAAASLAPD